MNIADSVAVSHACMRALRFKTADSCAAIFVFELLYYASSSTFRVLLPLIFTILVLILCFNGDHSVRVHVDIVCVCVHLCIQLPLSLLI